MKSYDNQPSETTRPESTPSSRANQARAQETTLTRGQRLVRRGLPVALAAAVTGVVGGAAFVRHHEGNKNKQAIECIDGSTRFAGLIALSGGAELRSTPVLNVEDDAAAHTNVVTSVAKGKTLIIKNPLEMSNTRTGDTWVATPQPGQGVGNSAAETANSFVWADLTQLEAQGLAQEIPSAPTNDTAGPVELQNNGTLTEAGNQVSLPESFITDHAAEDIALQQAEQSN